MEEDLIRFRLKKTSTEFLGIIEDEANSVEVGLMQVPGEILGLIFGWIGVKELYPHCFLINKKCLAAVLDDTIWQQRCLLLGISTLSSPSSSWRDTFREGIYPIPYHYPSPPKNFFRDNKTNKITRDDFGVGYWLSDPSRGRRNKITSTRFRAGRTFHVPTASAKANLPWQPGIRFIYLRGKNLYTFFWCCSAWINIKTKKKIISGVRCCDFTILHHDPTWYCGVGIIHEYWNSNLYSYTAEDKNYPFLFWNDGEFWDGMSLNNNTTTDQHSLFYILM